jgi:hypothetical protein
MSKRTSGVAQPEYRLLALITPLISMLISTAIFGETAQAVIESWAVVAVTVNFEYFGIVVSNLCTAWKLIPDASIRH